jgi:hypothetical protein
LRQDFVTRTPRHHRVLVANRTDARSRWRDHGVTVGVFEHLDVMAHQRGGLGEIAGVGVHLAATRLPWRENDLMA